MDLPRRGATTLVRVPQLDVPPTLVDPALGDAPPATQASATAPLPADPAFDSRYVRQATLGKGGMGVVHVASDGRIGREVAMKTMLQGRASRGDLVARFLREACVQGQLEHPAVVPVYDLGRDPSGALYFTMKRVRGSTFEQIIVQLRSGDPEAIRVHTRRKLLAAFGSICQAIDFSHTRGVIHRDLKPSNFMLGDFGEIYVLDWGVAKISGTPDDAAADLPPRVAAAGIPASNTLEGAALGTPGYMAPEQANGDTAIDARADVYALGSILFELLCFEQLHEGKTVEAMLASTVRGADARPSVRAPNLDIAPELDALCTKATSLDPKDRFQSVRELLDALERFLDGDRDLERRRQLALEHTVAAKRAAAHALEEGVDPIEALRRAFGEVGRALALDPSNAVAMETLVALLTDPPREMPTEVTTEMEAASHETNRGTARGALLGYLAWFLLVPFGWWMGVRSPMACAIAIATWGVAAVSTFVALRRGEPATMARYVGLLATALAASVMCAVCGPYVLVPTLAVINVMLWLLVSDRSRRPMIIGLGCLTILVPAALDWTNVVRFYNFREGHVTILQGMLDFPPVATHAFLLAASLALVGVTAVLITRFRDNLSDAERKLHLQAWQLRQLVPRTSDDTRLR